MDEPRMTPSEPEAREVVDRSASGAPAAGHAVRDIFSTDEIFHRLTATADEELARSFRLMFLSGIAAGLSIGLTMLARSAITALVPDGGPEVLGNLLYPVGFVLIVLGRYQLFTENTLTPVTLVLTRLASLPMLLWVWGVVLAANLVGVGLFALVLARTGVLSPEALEVAASFGRVALAVSTPDLFWKGVMAGFIVASMVWLTHAARETSTRFLVVFALMLLIPSADLFHCVIGAGEATLLVLLGEASPLDALRFFWPVMVGNTVGGVVLVATLNYSQTRDVRYRDRDCNELHLTWREWLLGVHTGAPAGPGRDLPSPDHHPVELAVPVDDDDHLRGDDGGGLTLLMYGDYQCPYTRRAYQDVLRLLDEGGGVRFAYRHYPLRRIHDHAVAAAKAAEAADLQGRFWEMHDVLFEHQDDLDDARIAACAREVGLDEERFDAERSEDEVQRRVERDRLGAVQGHLRGTPTLFLNGEPYRGDVALDALRDAAGEGAAGASPDRSAASNA